MAAPIYTPLPTAPARTMTPTAFAAAADAFVAALAAFQTEGDTLGAYTQTQAEAALAAAIAGNLSELDLAALAGFVIGVNDAGDALEGVELVPAMEVFQSKTTISSDDYIDIALASGVDEHIFRFADLIPETTASFLRMSASDDSLSTFEDSASEVSYDGGTYAEVVGSDTYVALTSGSSVTNNATETGVNGELIVRQLSGAYPFFRWECNFVNGGLRQVTKGDGVFKTTTDLTHLRFYYNETTDRITTSGEIYYTTKTYA